MSLLLQALSKAAKNRDANTDDPAVRGAADGDLSLEPMPEPQLIEEIAPQDDGDTEQLPAPDDAADLMRASETPSYNALDWARDHYMLTFLAGAALFAIIYGLYVYVQISNPAWMRPAPPPTSVPVQTMVAPPPAPANESPRISGLPAAVPAAERPDQQPSTLATASGDTTEPIVPPADRAGTTVPTSATIAAPGSAPVTTADDSSDRVERQVPAIVQPSTTTARARPTRNVSALQDNEDIEVVEIPVGPSVMALPDSATQSEQSSIEVQTRDSAFSRLDPMLMKAYEALQLGQYEKAATLYSEVLSRDPNSIDAMLGLAAIAWKQGRPAVATQYYGRVLELEPRNTHAQAGLIGILGNADPIAAETKLKQLIDREPSGFLYFTLGNLYAERSLWSQAQRAYFQAYQLQPENSDYAFNLAVGLEHLGQARLALDYYRKALDLSFESGRANFDQNLAIERVGQLSARVE